MLVVDPRRQSIDIVKRKGCRILYVYMLLNCGNLYALNSYSIHVNRVVAINATLFTMLCIFSYCECDRSR